MNNSLKKGLIFIFSFIIINSYIFSIDFEDDLILDTTASSIRDNNNTTDFINGSLNNVIITTDGNLKLKSDPSFFIKDIFVDNSNISFSKNLIFDNNLGGIKLNIINKTFGGKYMDVPNKVIETIDGGYLIIGTKFIVVSRGLSGKNQRADYQMAWLIKTDITGEIEWDRMFGGNSDDWGTAVKKTSDGGYIIGGLTGSFGLGHDAWLIKTDNNGKELWNKTYGGIDIDYAGEVIETSDNGFIIFGYTGNYGSGNKDYWLIKTDNHGNELWNKTYGGIEDEDGYIMKATSDGGYILAGITESYGNGDRDIWIVKIDKNGTMLWNCTYGGEGADQCGDVIPTIDGGYLIVGELFPNKYAKDLWIIKINNKGIEQWNKTYGGFHSDFGLAIFQPNETSYIIAGYYGGNSSHGVDAWLLSIDLNGNLNWDRKYGGKWIDRWIDVIPTNDGGYALIGETASFGAGDYDIWLLKTDHKGNDKPIGKLFSNNLLKNQSVSFINEFHYYCDLPNGTEIKIQFSKDNQSWYNSNGIHNGWNNFSSGINSINLFNLSWKNPNFYYKIFFQTKNHNAPKLFDIKLIYSKYEENGFFISQPFTSGGNNSWEEIFWESIKPKDTTIKFQIRTSKDENKLFDQPFKGPDGGPNSYYDKSGKTIWDGHGSDKWFQYKAYFFTDNRSLSPILKNVSITYNMYPRSIPIFPKNGSTIYRNTPRFSWDFFDLDSNKQIAFQLLISDDRLFEDVLFDSGEQKSINSSWQIQEKINDGIWYWKVRVKDIDGDWGSYCNATQFTINTNLPRSFITFPIDNGLYFDLNKITGKSSINTNNSMITKVEINIKRQSDKYCWDGINWSQNQQWLLCEGTYYWWYNTTSILWKSNTQYTLQSRATDFKNIVEIPKISINFSIINNISRPYSIIDTPLNNSYLNELNLITGQSFKTDFLNISQVEIVIKKIENNYYWNGINWSSNISWLLTNGTNKWTYNSSYIHWDFDLYYLIRSRVIDNDNNIENPRFGSKFMYDNKPPTNLSIMINKNENYTNSTTVKLSINAIDSGSGLSMIAFSHDNKTWTLWENFSNSKNYYLPNHNGQYIIYFKVNDKADNIAFSKSKKIILNTSLKLSDTDNDNIFDSFDAFPFDPAASIDNDGDKYPDYWNPGKTQKDSTSGLKIDQYPNDPKRHSQEKESDFRYPFIYTSIILLALIVSIFVILFSIIIKKRNWNIDTDSIDEKIIEKIKKDIAMGKTIELKEIPINELYKLLDEMFKNEEITDKTFNEIQTVLQDLELISKYKK